MSYNYNIKMRSVVEMTLKEDARIVKTKAKLLETFKTLLAEKPIEDITVNEICELADVRRATFYKHFADKYAFLKYLVGSLRYDFDQSLPKKKRPDETSAYYVEYIYGITGFITKNDQIIKNALKSEVLSVLIDVIQEKNYEDTRERLSRSVEKGMTLPASIEVTAAMMTGAVTNAILRWLKDGKAVPVNTLADEIAAVIAAMQN